VTCEAVEIAIEMRLHGGGPVAPGVDEHLGGCAACRAFEALARRATTRLAEETSAEAARVDWATLEAEVLRRCARDDRRRFALVAALLAVEGVAMWTFNAGHRRIALAGFAQFAAVVLATVALVSAIRGVRLRVHERAGADLVAYLRGYVRRRLRATRVGALLSALLGVVFVAVRIGQPVSPAEWLGAALMASTLWGTAAYLLLVRRPALQRELDGFDRQGV
jgi:predicted anti-sigma-YlaC factor YlaD